MTVNLVLFFILATVAVISSLGMLLSRNAIYSALFLVLNFSTVAVFYLLLGAPFIAITQVTVYAGAIMVLFLFVIMLLGADPLPESERPPRWQRPLAVVLALILAVEGIFLISTQKAAGIITPDPVEITGSPQAIGELLFSQYLLPFEMTSILLLVAMIGAIVLTHHKEKGGQS